MNYWLSHPSPSQFAVQSLYFDIRVNGAPGVVDALTLAPLTPNVTFTVYYSSDTAGPGTDPSSWDGLLWTPVYKTFQASRATTYALPAPVVAKYLKVEFTNLQAASYDPGAFQLPTTYNKYPKWVLDYFLGRFARQTRDLLSSGVAVTYDAIDLAYAYHTADITQVPDPPALSQTNLTAPVQFGTDASDQIDATTLAQIRIDFQPFLSPPTANADPSTALGSFAQASTGINYSTESISTALGDTSVVSNHQREQLIVEKSLPDMFFYLPCRHAYRVAQTTFEKNIGYFAGVTDLIWHRANYTNAADTAQYSEPLADHTNLSINDSTQPAALPR